jgi:hypothetical protein
MTIKEVLENPETPATVLIVVAVDLIGEEVLQYDIDAIVDTFADVYKAQLPNNALDKIQGDFKPVEGSFMDDEIIFGAHYSINSDLIQDVEDYLTQRAKLILDLIDLLPLSNRDPQSWSKLKPA